jgi:hypothetical protein
MGIFNDIARCSISSWDGTSHDSSGFRIGRCCQRRVCLEGGGMEGDSSEARPVDTCPNGDRGHRRRVSQGAFAGSSFFAGLWLFSEKAEASWLTD